MPTESANNLINSRPEEVLLWIEKWLGQGKKVDLNSDINWSGLAECAAAYACDTSGKHTVLQSIMWGSIAVIIREQLAKAEEGRQPSLDDSVIVRHNLIIRFGNHPGDPLFDSNVIVAWFYRQLSMPFEQATRHAENWHDPAKREFAFKLLVERLELIKNLVTSQRLVPDHELRRWLGILQILGSQ